MTDANPQIFGSPPTSTSKLQMITTDRPVASLGEDLWQEARLIGWMPSLMHGVTLSDGSFATVRQENLPSSAEDPKKYETDFAIRVNGDVVGWLDPEHKKEWREGSFPYSDINIARYPMSNWRSGRYTGNETNKLRRFREYPALSMFVAVRRDSERIACLWFADALRYGRDKLQPTRYTNNQGKNVPVAVIATPAEHRIEIDASFPDALSRLIVARLEEVLCADR
jgi:hypothetical protein